MKRRTKIGLVAATLPALAWAAPAGASRAEGQDTATFTYEGQQMSCTVAGSTHNDYQTGTNSTYLSIHTSIQGPSRCEEAAQHISSATNFVNEKGDQETHFASSTRTRVLSTAASKPGRITDVVTYHSVTFRCDHDPEEACSVGVEFSTAPK